MDFLDESETRLNLMRRKIDFVISDEIMPVETQPLIRRDSGINFIRKQHEIKDCTRSWLSTGDASMASAPRRD